jgi:hypothetical protein
MPIAAIYGPDDFANIGHGHSAPPRSRITPAEPAYALPMPSLEWTPEVERATAHLYERVKKVIAPVEWPLMAPYVKAINELKQTRGAVILAHNYQTPEIFHCVADIRGDSLQLAIEATKVKSDIIVQCGVHFMAETSKILNPHKMVLIPDSRAGCSLAAVARAISGCTGRGLCQHIGRGEGRGRYLLHLIQRGAGSGEPSRAHGDVPAGPVSGEICGFADQREDHRLEGRLRSA